MAFSVAVILVQYKSLAKYNKLLKCLENTPNEEYVLGPCLTHHFMVVGCYLASGFLLGLAVPMGVGSKLTCADSIMYLVVNLICFTYGHTLTTIPELVMTSFMISLKTSVKKSISSYTETKNVREFCRQQEGIYFALKTLGEVFGLSVVATVFFNTLILIMNLYFCFISVTQRMSFKPPSSNIVGFVELMLSLLSLKRLLHLANQMQYLMDRLDEAIEELILVDTNHPDRSRALQVKMLLDRVDGLPALGFFTLKRGILLAIISNLLTYLIILFEFKLDN